MIKNKTASTGIIRDFDLKRTHVRLTYRLILIVSLIIIVVGILPLVWVFLSGFKDIKEFIRDISILPKSFNIMKYVDTWGNLKFVKYYRNSFISVAGSVVCAILFNGLFGYALSKIKPAGSSFLYALVLWGLLIPSTTSIVPLFMNITRLKLNGTFIPLWFSMGANAFYVVLFKNFFDTLPKSLIEAAKIDGATDVFIFQHIAIPLSKAITMVVIMYAVTAAWSDFLLPYLILNNSGLETVMVRLFQFRGSKATDVEILRAIVFVMVPPIILFLIFQKQITQVTIQSGIKG